MKRKVCSSNYSDAIEPYFKKTAYESNVSERSWGMPNKSALDIMKSSLISHPITWASNIIPQESQSRLNSRTTHF